MFAVSEVDPSVGTLSAKYIKKGKNVTDGKVVREIDLVPCEELLPGGRHAGESNSSHFDLETLLRTNRASTKYRCPLNIHDVSLTGHYNAEAFDYIKIALNGCQMHQKEDEQDKGCVSEEELAE